MDQRVHCWALIFVVCFCISGAAKVTHVHPRHGSLNGATRLTIYGIDFAKDLFNYGAGKQNVGNKVELVSKLQNYACDIHKDGCSETQIMCYTRPMSQGTYYVRVTVDGTKLPHSSLCNDPFSSACSFTTTRYRTPRIEKAEPRSMVPRSMVKMSGYIVTSRYGSHMDKSTNDKTVKLLRVYVGGQKCELRKPDSDELYGLVLENGGLSDKGYIECKMEGTYVGNINGSFIVEEYGRSKPDPSVLRITGQNKIAMFQSYAEITSISPSSGSVEGGTLLTVSGRNFDKTDAPAQVQIGDVPCMVKELKTTYIICETKPKPSPLAAYPGNRGWLREIWNATSKYQATLSSMTNYLSPDEAHVLDETTWTESSRNKYVSRSQGYFLPPSDNEFQFFIKADDEAELYLSTSDDPAGAQKIAECTKYARTYTIRAAQASQRIALKAGKRYFMEVRHKEHAGSAGASVAVKMYKTLYRSSQSGMAKAEIQSIKSTSDVQDESQTISLSNWKTQSSVREVQEVTVTYLDASYAIFRLGMYGVYTAPLSGGATASQVKTELNKLQSVAPDAVEVTGSNIVGGMKYIITFKSERGDWDMLQGDGINVNFAIKEKTKGKPSMKFFVLEYNGASSPPIYSTAKAKDVKTALGELFGVQCPSDITKPAAKKFHQDFEKSTSYEESGTRTSEVEPFCGRTSVKNPDFLFYMKGSSQEISVIRHPKLCFAYNGGLLPQLKVNYTCDDGGQVRQYNDKLEVTIPPAVGWAYTCIDMMTLLQSRRPSATSFKVRRIYIFRNNTMEDVYVDNIYIGSKEPTTDVEGIASKRRMRPKSWDVKSFDVTDAGSKTFNVTIKTVECAHNLAFIGVRHGQIVSANSIDASYGGSNWPSGSKFLVHRNQAASPPISGTFDLTIRGDKISGIPADAEPEDLKSQLETLKHMGIVSVDRTGTCFGYEWTIEWKTATGDQPALLLDKSKVTGHNSDMSATTTQDGGVFFDPISGDMLRTVHNKPQVSATINGVPTACAGDCTFEWTVQATPTVTSSSPTSGSKKSNTRLTINGSGFHTDTPNNTVTIGGEACVVVTANPTTLTCDIGRGPAGTYDIIVNVADKGLAQHTGGTKQFIYKFAIDGISPSSGGIAGGTDLLISGTGFGPNVTAQVGGKKCEISNANYSTVVCKTPAASADASVDVKVEDGPSVATSASKFSYQTAVTPVITGLSSNVGIVEGGALIKISGTGFGSAASSDDAVVVGKTPAIITSYSDTAVDVTLPSLAPGSYPLLFQVGSKGYADTRTKNIPNIDYKLNVASVHPQRGSLQGGTVVTLTGEGFSTNKTANVVKFGGVTCDVTSASSNKVVCVMQSSGKLHKVTNLGDDPANGVGYAWEPAIFDIEVGDIVEWIWTTPNEVTDIGYLVQQTKNATDIRYDGSGFSSGNTKTSHGRYQFQFGKPGKNFYWSGPVDASGSIVLRGVINVKDKASFSDNLSFKIGTHEAIYSTSSGVSNAGDTSSCPGTTSPIRGCSDAQPTGTDATKFSFSCWKCATPTVTSISPIQGASTDSITIKGTGFSTTKCQNEVTVGGKPCVVSTSSANSIKCSTDPQDSLTVGIPHVVKVKVNNLGTALNTLPNDLSKRFVVLPHVSTVTPNKGSTAGGTFITIVGGGFHGNPNQISVSLSGNICNLKTVTYTKITCITSQAWTSIATVTVSVNSNGVNVNSKCSGKCLFDYADWITPKVTGTSPTAIGSPNSQLTLLGTRFGSVAKDVTVLIGAVPCVVTAVKNTQILCTVGSVIVGIQPLSVNIAGKGSASTFSPTIPVNAQINNITPDKGSIHGHTMLTISGHGFQTAQTSVKVGSKDCLIKSVTTNEIKCSTPSGSAGTSKVTVTSNAIGYPTVDFTYTTTQTPTVSTVSPTSGKTGDSVQISGSGFGTVVNDVMVTFDDASCQVTTVTDSIITCQLGAHSAGTFGVEVDVGTKGRATSIITFDYALAVASLSPNQGSYGGGQTITIQGTGFDATKTNVTVCGSKCAVVGIPSPTQLLCNVPANAGSGASVACDVVVSVGSAQMKKSNSYTYLASQTATITGVNPKRGGTGGGTKITIDGTGFGTNNNQVKVTIAGTQCVVSSLVNTKIICTTGAHKPSVETTVRVEIGNSGIAKQISADFQYIDIWSSVYTWGGVSVPVAGDFVVVPKDMTLLLDTNTPVLKMLLIRGGKVIFDRKDIQLQTENVLITDGGLFQVGTENEPFLNKAVITLHGNLRSQELPIYGTKTIAVREGTLDLHGKPVGITWTRLGATATAGSTQITLETKVFWQAGDQIVIATTNHRHSQQENEKHEIASISSNGLTLTLKNPLKYKHLGETVNLGGGKTLEARAEVGLLTHNVVVRGSNQVQWNDKIEACPEGFDTGEFAVQTCFQGRFGEEMGSDQFGSQIMLHAQRHSQGLVVGRISNVEVTNAGQAFRLGRYAIHFHLNGDMAGSYVRSSSIHRSFNRAINVHGTHNVLLEHNVLYDIMGGAMFLEDGIETGNIFQYNLAVFVKSSTSLLNDDITPAAFWLTNPNNTVRHNAAAGGTHFGFWYRMHAHPDGPSFDPNICPRKVPLGEFRNNTVHSQGWFGIWIFQHFYPMEGGCCSCNVPKAAKFYSLTAWNNEKGAEWVGGGAIHFINFLLVNNEVSGLDMKLISNAERYTEKGAKLVDITVAAKPASPGIMAQSTTKSAFILPYAFGLKVSGTTFINFNDKGKVALGVTQIDGKTESLNGGFRYLFERTTFINTPNKVSFRWENEAVIHDLDGTFSGTVNGKVVATTPSLPSSQCTQKSEFSIGKSGSVCAGSVNFHRFSFNDPAPSSLMYKNVTFTNQYGTTVSFYRKKRVTHPQGWMVLLVSGETYDMKWSEAAQLTNISYLGKFYEFEQNQYMVIQHNFTQRPDAFHIEPNVERNESASALTFTNNYNGDWFFDDKQAILNYFVSQKKRSSTNNKDRSVQLRVYRCRYTNCMPPPDPANIPPADDRPSNFSRWSKPSSWYTMDQTVPKDGEDWTIPSGVWMVVDKDTLPQFNKIYIYGVLELEFLPDPVTGKHLNFNISATHIFISGGRFIVGWEKNPFRGQANIILRGDHFSPDMPLHDGPNVGSKAIGVFGGLDIHGIPRPITWTRLAKTASSGSTVITLDKAVDWAAGEEIVISSTSYSAWQTETFKIISVASDKKTLTLNGALKYNHIVAKESLGGGKQVLMAAEVGLLTRNVKIIGNDYPKLTKESFGARVLVGTYSDGERDWTGYARISNTEFFHTGQEGWTDFYDPRYSLAFLDAGTVSSNKPSYVKNNAFNYGFATAIGVYGTNGIVIDDNVIYRTVGSGVIVWGSDTKVRRNLGTLTIFTGTYNGRTESYNVNWYATFEVQQAKSLVFQGNVAAGSERAGIHTHGEPCPGEANSAEPWIDNVAHSALIGVYTEFPTKYSGRSSCSLISNFTSYRNWDFGFYHQTVSSLKFQNIISVDNTLGLYPMVIGPSATSHASADKYVDVSDSYFVGTSDSFDCVADVLSSSDNNIEYSKNGRSWKSASGGKVGMSWPTFSSSSNAQPVKPFIKIMAYQAINGIMTVSGVTFSKFRTNCGSKGDVIVTTNPKNDDAIHPLRTRQISLINVDTDKVVWIHRPRVSTINPADCVDMDCDGLKKAILDDMDGSLFGGNSGTILSQSEWEWDGDRRRGLGDYRIPKTMLTKLNGDRIPVADIAPNKGIVRDNTCIYKSSYQAYECHGLDYEMLMLENLDADTETRRVSPVAVLADKYVDLVNGPQDHGWCMGYTCQKRLSTFPIILAMDKTYQIFYTGTSPQKSRLHLLNAHDKQTVIVGIYYADARRFDVYVQDKYVVPTNAYYNAQGQQLRRTPTSKGQYMPDMTSDPVGTNYFDREYSMLHVLLRGKTVVDIRMSALVVVAFEVPPMTVDQFFGANMVKNIALLLQIPEEKIKIASSVRATSRRRRAVGNTIVTVEIGNEPLNGTNETDPTSLTYAQLSNVTVTLINSFQTNNINTALNTSILSLSIVEPLPPSNSQAWQTLTSAGSAGKATQVQLPQNMVMPAQPVPLHEGTAFSVQPQIKMVDKDGNLVTQLGSKDQSWEVTASLRIGSGSNSAAVLLGNKTAVFSNGWANFSGLGISHNGNGYIIDFTISQPTGSSLLLASAGLTVNRRPLSAKVISSPSTASENTEFNMQLEIVDGVTAEKIADIGWKGHSWTCLPALYFPDIYAGTLSGALNTSVSRISGIATFTDLSLSKRNKYFVSVRCVSSPADYDFTVVSNAIDITPVGYVAPTTERYRVVTLTFNGDFDIVAKGKEIYFASAVINNLMGRFPNVTYTQPSATKGSIKAVFTIQGFSIDVDNTLVGIWGEVKRPLSITFDGTTVKTSMVMLVDGTPYYGNDPQAPTIAIVGLSVGVIIGIIVVALLMVALVIGFIVWRALYLKSKEPAVIPSKGSKGDVMMVHLEEQDYMYTVKGTAMDEEPMEENNQEGTKIVSNVAPGNTLYPGNVNYDAWRLTTPRHRPWGRLSPLIDRGRISPVTPVTPILQFRDENKKPVWK